MRVKQTARKSTAAKQTTSDPVRSRMSQLLVTKRPKIEPGESSRASVVSTGLGKGKGKRIYSRTTYEPVKKKPRAKSGVIALREIKRLQASTDLLIPRAPFHRLVREITQALKGDEDGGCDIRYQVAALEALQQAAESYVVNLLGDAYLCSIHASRGKFTFSKSIRIDSTILTRLSPITNSSFFLFYHWNSNSNGQRSATLQEAAKNSLVKS